MNKKLYYCLPTYKAFDLAYQSVLAVLQSTKVPDQIIIIDNSGNGAGSQYLQPLTEKFCNVFIWPQTYNIGVAASWNTFHRQICDDYIIIANDDIKVHPETLEKMVYAASTQPDEIFFYGDANYGNAYSLFLLTKHGFHTIGAFDETFYPAYFEDNDHSYRARQKGYKLNTVLGAGYDHEVSSTMKRYTQQEMDAHHNSFRNNALYYARKWGGMPHEEEFITAFNK